jgi:hypothetical protein
MQFGAFIGPRADDIAGRSANGFSLLRGRGSISSRSRTTRTCRPTSTRSPRMIPLVGRVTDTASTVSRPRSGPAAKDALGGASCTGTRS